MKNRTLSFVGVFLLIGAAFLALQNMEKPETKTPKTQTTTSVREVTARMRPAREQETKIKVTLRGFSSTWGDKKTEQ